MSPSFPSTPHVFVPVAGAAKTRVFLLEHSPHLAQTPNLRQVATLSGPAELGALLVEALNTAAWTGDESDLDQLASEVPSPVLLSCRAALADCPRHTALALGFDDVPLTVVQEVTFFEGATDIAREANAALDLGLGFVVENVLAADGKIEFNTTLLSGDRETTAAEQGRWWAIPPGWNVTERLHLDAPDLETVLNDPRWETRHGRVYWLWIRDDVEADADHWSATARWVVEFFDAPLAPDRNWQIFLPTEYAAEERGFLTERNRFILWISLSNISADLDGLCADGMEWDSLVRDDMPDLVHDQPLPWWIAMAKSADRLCEAARRGAIDELVPRTPAEEALICLAVRRGYVDWARDTIRAQNLEDQVKALPTAVDDDVWEEILGDLTGDVDVEALWWRDRKGIEDPDDPVNRHLGMGDYRPQAWHRLFDRAIPHGEDDLTSPGT